MLCLQVLTHPGLHHTINKICTHNLIRDGLAALLLISSSQPGTCCPRQNSISSHSSTYHLTHTPSHSIYPSIQTQHPRLLDQAGDLLDRNMILIPIIAVDPFGRFGLILLTFLFDTQPTNPITLTLIKPNTTLMYYKITHFPIPKGILKLANHNWKLTQTQRFYGHSYSAPTPTINTLQQLGLTITKAFALHIHYAQHGFLDHSVLTSEPDTTIPLFNGQSIGTLT